MVYYHIELLPGSKQFCTIITPWGKYEYQKLPMKVYNTPNIFHEKIPKLFEGFNMVCAYINYKLVIPLKYSQENLKALEKVL